MSKWYFYDETGIKRGPFDEFQIKELVFSRAISQNTILESDTGLKGKAEQLKSLTAPPVISPPAANGTKVIPPADKTGDGFSIDDKPASPAAPVSQAAEEYCSYCGKPVSPQASVCLKCGTDPRKHRNYCRNCGAKLHSEQIICVKCGVTVGMGKSRPGTSSDFLPQEDDIPCLKSLFKIFVGCCITFFVALRLLYIFGNAGEESLVVFILIAAIASVVVNVAVALRMLSLLWRQIPQGYTDVTPKKAAGFLLIPLFNYYWCFTAYRSLAETLNRCLRDKGSKTAVSVTNTTVILILSILYPLAPLIHPIVDGILTTFLLIAYPLMFKEFIKAAEALRGEESRSVSL